ncbi:Hypothetical predicted protein [Paramuricea clavata]|nr:Hypothetical predicted protein [Paramuricea clavata]
MKNSDEVSCSQQELCETLTQRSDKSGKVKTQSELDTIHAIQVSAPSEAKISSMGETQAHGASGENNWGRLHKKVAKVNCCTVSAKVNQSKLRNLHLTTI